MLYALFELNGIEEAHFIKLAPEIEEIGKMLYVWKRRAEKESSSANSIRPSKIRPI